MSTDAKAALADPIANLVVSRSYDGRVLFSNNTLCCLTMAVVVFFALYNMLLLYYCAICDKCDQAAP